MEDAVLSSFLMSQLESGRKLAASSDLLELVPMGPAPVHRYLVRFSCKGLIRERSGEVVETDRFEVGVRFPQDYLRRAHPAEVLTWLGPINCFHPNILYPWICVGHLAPGTPLVDLIFQVFEIVTYNKVTMTENNALNRDACVWCRGNLDRLPVDRRALKRSVVTIPVAEATRPLAEATRPAAEAPR